MLPNGAGDPTVVTHLSGQKFSIRIRSHELVVDQTIRGGGADSAPTPIELLGAALGSCIAYYVNQFLETRHMETAGLSVEVVQTKGTNPSRIENFQVRLALPHGVTDEHLPMLWRVVHACPAHNTLSMGAEIGIAMSLADRELIPA